MTLRIPKALLIVLSVVLLIGAGVAIYLTLIKSDEVCYSDSGAEADCDDEGALTEAEYDEQQSEEAEAEQAEAEAERVAAKCEDQLGALLAEARELDARLNVGVSYEEYSDMVGDVSVAYQAIAIKELDTQCTFDVGIHLEDAMNSYIKAENIWNDCIDELSCDDDSIDPELQEHWATAASKIDSAERGQTQLAQP